MPNTFYVRTLGMSLFQPLSRGSRRERLVQKEKMALIGKVPLFCVVLVVFLAVYLNYPEPGFSTKLQEWRDTGKYFNYKGNAIFYQDTKGKGDPEKVLLCIHGFPTSSYDWSKVWEPLLEKFGRIIAADMLGLGFSDKPLQRDYTVMEQATIQELLLQSLGISKVHILAHDLGDTVALELLARFHDAGSSSLQIQSFCLSNGGIFPETNFPRPIQKLLLTPMGPVLARLSSFPVFAYGFAAVFGPATKPSDSELQDFWAAARHKDGHLVTSSILQYINQRKQNADRWVGVLKTTSLPVHLIYGPADPVNPPVMLARYRKLVTRGTFTELPQDVGHYPHWEMPEGFIQGYAGYLKRVHV